MTINDIAKIAGVSVATVSRVMNKKGYVREETRKKVEAIIRDHGYHPNAVARSLISSHSSLIAVIMAERPFSFSSKVLETIESCAGEQGDSVLFYGTGAEQERELRAFSQAFEHQVKGILLLPVMESGEAAVNMIREAEAREIPVVLLDWDLYGEDFDRVVVDNKQVLYDGTRLLLEEGQRKIGVITCREVAKEGSRRRDGYLQCMKDHQIPLKDSYIYDGDFDEESGYDACRTFFALPDPPTAVLACCSSATLGCFHYFKEQNMELGKDVGLVGFDDISLVESMGYPVTTLDRLSREMGRNACSLLYQSMRNGADHKKIVLATRTIRRGSEHIGRCFSLETKG